MALVVDASVSASWFLPDEATPYTEAALQATTASGVWVPERKSWPVPGYCDYCPIIDEKRVNEEGRERSRPSC